MGVRPNKGFLLAYSSFLSVKRLKKEHEGPGLWEPPATLCFHLHALNVLMQKLRKKDGHIMGLEAEPEYLRAVRSSPRPFFHALKPKMKENSFPATHRPGIFFFDTAHISLYTRNNTHLTRARFSSH